MTSAASTVRELIDRNAAQQPLALYALATESGTAITHGELARSCRRVCALLQTHGAGAGATVSVVMPNGLATLRVLLGAMYGGRCVNPVNLLAQPEQMRYVLGHSDCKLVVVAPEWELRVREMIAGLDRAVAVIVADPDALALPGEPDDATCPEAPQPAADSPALLMYTSGTTGVPKGVLLTQANLCANAEAISAEHALTAGDRVLAVLPLYHINAFAVTMLAPLARGGSLAVAPKFSAARFWAQAGERACQSGEIEAGAFR